MPEPKIKDWQLERLKYFANSTAAYLFCPIYLGGSALYKENPRDVDIFAVISDWDFYLRFGRWQDWTKERRAMFTGEITWKLARECHKRWRQGCAETMLCLDFKIIPAILQIKNYSHLPVYRLDDSPFEIEDETESYGQLEEELNDMRLWGPRFNG
jgi:hypothetical protein